MRWLGHLFSIPLTALLCLTISCGTGSSQTGLDTSFGTSGKTTLDFNSADDEAFAMGIQSTGNVIIAGRMSSSGQYDFALARLKTDGTVDTTFGTAGKTTTDFSGGNDTIYSLAILSDDTIIVAGTASGGSASTFALAKYSKDGILDSTFGTSGKVSLPIGSTQDEIRSIAITSTGKIVAAGFSKSGSRFKVAVVRLSSTGSLDTDFNTTGKNTYFIGSGDDKALALTLQSDGKAVIAGSTVTNTSTLTSQMFVSRLSTDGTLDANYGSAGTFSISNSTQSGLKDVATGVSVLSSGGIIVSGTSDNGTAPKLLLAKSTSAGALDTTFNSNGLLATTLNTVSATSTTLSYVQSEGTCQASQSNGYVIAGGILTTSAGTDFGLLRVNPQGSADLSFGTYGLQSLDFGSNDEPRAVVTTGSAVFVVGKAYNGANYDFAIAKYYQ
ncbi:MAG: hypothetical protein HYR96_07345 [Deltaproteobacteria bacterium]|nr:hypothetical protein [Deltaproteobacteria bacterium]MBI3295156.1 hypothetical protein [Deltaproteobacteria bacterium]